MANLILLVISKKGEVLSLVTTQTFGNALLCMIVSFELTIRLKNILRWYFKRQYSEKLSDT